VVTTADGARDPLAVVGSDRLLVVLDAPAALPGRRPGDAWSPPDGSTTRIHIGTDQTGAILGRSGRDAVTLPDGRALALLRLDRPVATAVGERFVLRRPRPAALLAGGIVLDPDPARGRSRRRQSTLRLSRLVAAVGEGDQEAILAALIELHGHLISSAGPQLAADVQRDAADAILAAVEAYHREHPKAAGLPLSAARGTGSTLIRRSVSIDRPAADEAAITLLAGMLADGRLERSGETVHLPGRGVPLPDPVREEAMRRLLQALDDPAPPALRSAASAASCPPDAVRELERNALIVVVDDDLAWSAAAFERLSDQALGLATAAPLTPAALRDATGTSRKYVMALLEELDRRGLLRRTPEGHVPGPRA
jgi:selenocysteine-specific elongation factor